MLSSTVNAKCLKDIFTVGLSGDSVAYNGKRDNDAKLKIATESGIGFLGAWTIFCPKEAFEVQSYIRLRKYTFDLSKLSNELRGVPESLSLLSFGVEVRKPIFLWKYSFEIPFEVEVREEMGFKVNLSSGTGSTGNISKEDYKNLKLMSGLRWFYWSDDKNDLTLVGKLGILFPFAGADDATLAYLMGMSAEWYRKLGKKLSIRFDLYYHDYWQDFGTLKMSRTELGARSNLVFRF